MYVYKTHINNAYFTINITGHRYLAFGGGARTKFIRCTQLLIRTVTNFN